MIARSDFLLSKYLNSAFIVFKAKKAPFKVTLLLLFLYLLLQIIFILYMIYMVYRKDTGKYDNVTIKYNN